MAKQSLMWTALPNGFDATGALRVSAMVSPRLEPDADQIVKEFTDFIDWPAAVASARFTIQYGPQSISIDGSQTAGPARIDDSIDLPDSQTWTTLIPESTFVSGYQFQDLSSNAVLSYDTVALHSLTQNLYVNLGRSTSDQLPKVSQFLTDPVWRGLIDAVASVDRTFKEEKTGLRDSVTQFARFKQNALQLGSPVADLLARTQLFHTPPSTPKVQDYSGASLDPADPRKTMKGWRMYDRSKLPDKADFEHQIDFHQIVAAMNQYPRLLRRLGLVIDFIIPAGTFAASPNQPLSVVCDLATANQPGVTRSQASPRTRTRLTTSQFDPVPRPSLQAGDYRAQDGLLVINPDFFAILQTDIDAAGLKLMNFARTLRRMDLTPVRQVDPVTKFEKDAGAPALRNAGLMLVQRRRGQGLSNAFAKNKAKDQALKSALQSGNNALAPDLFAEDVVRGWRIDIWDGKTKRWRSLCERQSTHALGGGLIVQDDHEGMVRLAATKSPDPASNTDIVYLHEALISWTGWSLVAPQPGQLIDAKDQPAGANAEVPPGIQLENKFVAAAGTLPRLRYGRRYWIRARVTDLAGNSLPPNEKDYGPEQPNTNAVTYFRFEPIQAPSVALVRAAGVPEKPAEGESMERIAIRSFNATPADNVIPATQTARRYAVPARSSVKDAELHGMFDSSGKLDDSQATFDMLAAKDDLLPEVKLQTPGPLANPTPVETTYAVLDEPAAAIPYLPDPLCITIAARVFDHPGFPSSTILHIPVYSSGGVWPNALPFTVRVIEDPAKTVAFDAVNRVLEVSLPKAARATLRLSCEPSAGALLFMGVWNWLPSADRTPALTTQAQTGQHWMLTPWRTLELVHAVQKPLIAPEMKFTLGRGFGETRALPQFTATCSLKSTSVVDLQAAWHEPDGDTEATAGGADRARTDHAYGVKITDARSYAMRKFDPKATGIPEHDIAGTDMISVGQNAHDSIIKYHEFNDTRYRRIQYWLEATTRFREFMPGSVLTKFEGGNLVETDENIKVTGPSLTTWVPSSAPPPEPHVLYVVPTFGWVTATTPEVTSKWRRGGGLRVYLNRGWNASGYGEMLAVVLPRSAFAEDPNTSPSTKPYKKFVTQWGNDPIWASAFVSGPTPRVSNFPLARTGPDPTGKWLPSFAPATEADQPPGPFPVADLPHPALGPHTFGDTSGLVDVVPHDVFYDSERRLWYCDIEMNFGASYFPFVRLALARYQPVSVPTAHLSNIVLADFMALAPDRWLTISYSLRVRNVSLHGHSYSDSSSSREARFAPSTVILNQPEIPANVAPSSVVEVWVERLDPALGEDFGWKKDNTVVVAKGSANLTAAPAERAALRDVDHISKIVEERQFDAAIRQNLIPVWPTLWNGTVTLPQIQPEGARYRLVVAEYEEYLVDDATPYNLTPSAKDRRLVYVEHVELT